jgi:hypothetical protein
VGMEAPELLVRTLVCRTVDAPINGLNKSMESGVKGPVQVAFESVRFGGTMFQLSRLNKGTTAEQSKQFSITNTLNETAVESDSACRKILSPYRVVDNWT